MAEVADAAVGNGPAVGLRLVADGGEEAAAGAPVVRVELGDPERLPLAEPVLDVHVLDGAPLDPRDLLGVEEELQHVRGLRAAGELRVDRLVAGVRLPLEEVGEPEPGSVREARLVDHVGLSRPDLALGEARRLVEVEVLVVGRGQRDDGLTLADQPGEVRVLVLVPLAEDEVAVRRAELRLHDLAARGGERQRRQVRAGEVVGEVGRREPQRPVVA